MNSFMPQKNIVFLKTYSKLNKNKLLQDRHQNHIMDEIDKLLEQLALAVPPPIPDEVSDSETIIQQKTRKKALNRLIYVIQQSGKLFCLGRDDFPLHIYQEALQETWLYICRNIHNYNPQKGKVMTLAVSAVNFYCQCLEIETDLTKSHSQNLVWQKLMNIAYKSNKIWQQFFFIYD